MRLFQDSEVDGVNDSEMVKLWKANNLDKLSAVQLLFATRLLPPPPLYDPVGQVTLRDQVGLWPHFCDEKLSDPLFKKTI